MFGVKVGIILCKVSRDDGLEVRENGLESEKDLSSELSS